jgi:hypothetical protein
VRRGVVQVLLRLRKAAAESDGFGIFLWHAQPPSARGSAPPPRRSRLGGRVSPHRAREEGGAVGVADGGLAGRAAGRKNAWPPREPRDWASRSRSSRPRTRPPRTWSGRCSAAGPRSRTPSSRRRAARPRPPALVTACAPARDALGGRADRARPYADGGRALSTGPDSPAPGDGGPMGAGPSALVCGAHPVRAPHTPREVAGIGTRDASRAGEGAPPTAAARAPAPPTPA